RRDPLHGVRGPPQPAPQVRHAPLLQRAGGDLAGVARRGPADPRGQPADRTVAASPLHAASPRRGPPGLSGGRTLLRRGSLEKGTDGVHAISLMLIPKQDRANGSLYPGPRTGTP